MAIATAFGKALGEKITAGRQKQGYSQAQLAELTDVSRGQIARYEAGSQIPSAHTLRLLASALGVKLEALTPPVAKRTSKPSGTVSR